jgi:hypothetical protein
LLRSGSFDSDNWEDKMEAKEDAQNAKLDIGSSLFNKLIKRQNSNASMLSAAKTR